MKNKEEAERKGRRLQKKLGGRLWTLSHFDTDFCLNFENRCNMLKNQYNFLVKKPSISLERKKGIKKQLIFFLYSPN